MLVTADMAFRAVADPTRRQILDVLARGECAVGDLVKPLGISQPAVSQQLKLLKELGLVRQRRDGRRVLCSLVADPLREIDRWLTHYREFWTEKFNALEQLLDELPDDAP